jgi:ribosomal protein S18 acetylase RimI-like enzyme
MTFRILTTNDFQEVLEMWKQAGLHCDTEEHEKSNFENTILKNPDICIAATENNKIIGTILAGYDGHTTTLYRVAVHKEFQGKGIGSQMLKEMENRLKEKNIKKVFLKVHCSNTKVIDFYKNNEYKEMDYAKVFYKEI